MDNHRLSEDPSFIDAIVHEVKSQGLFDQFRRECLSDVDTKPAYQNLRQRVENSVASFLSQQTWAPDLNRNQLREKLRKNIIEAGFLDTGVERIVDQVVNPKISTVFHPKVKDIVYDFLGIEKPKLISTNGSLGIDTDFLPGDLEAVSPDSDKKSLSASSDVILNFDCVDELNESKENADEFESPPFEPLEGRPPSEQKQESNDSHSSKISGLTSQESVESESNPNNIPEVCETKEPTGNGTHINQNMSIEAAHNDSQLSQVSSNSRLSIITNSGDVTNPRLDITEEAQMPKFNDNSNSEEFNKEIKIQSSAMDIDQPPQKSNFDLQKEEYDFKGTERKTAPLFEEGKVKGENSEFIMEEQVQPIAVKEEENIKPEPKFEEASSHSERSLRICEETATEAKELNTSVEEKTPEMNSPVENPILDEISSGGSKDNKIEKKDEKSRDKDKHRDKYKYKKSDRKDRDKDKRTASSSRHHSSSSSKDKTSSSKDDRSKSSSRHHDDPKDHRDKHRSHRDKDKYRKSSSSHHHSDRDKDHHRKRHSSSKSKSDNKEDEKSKEEDARKVVDDHSSAHDKPIKKRRSTDRDSNDGANSQNNPNNGTNTQGKGEGSATSSITSSQSSLSSSSSTPQSPARDSQEKGEATNEKSDDNTSALNDTNESAFEGFEDSPVKKSPQTNRKKSQDKKTNNDKTVKKVEKIKSPLPISHKSFEKPTKSAPSKDATSPIVTSIAKIVKLDKKSPKPIAPKEPKKQNIEVFSFSFDKPLKLGKNGEIIPEPEPEPELDSTSELTPQNNESRINDAVNDDSFEIELDNEEGNISAQKLDDSEDMYPEKINKSMTLDPDSLVTYPTPPVIVDQMLTNDDTLDLELLIGQNHIEDKATRDQIEKTLQSVKAKIKKPRFASNIFEAKKMMKIRKQMERKEKKLVEQAMVLAKKYIIENKSENNKLDDVDNQGIELEFVCDNNSKTSGPLISSPVRNISKLGKSEDDLRALPEPNAIYLIDTDLFNYLRKLTENYEIVDVPDISHFNVKLFSIQSMIQEDELKNRVRKNILKDGHSTESESEKEDRLKTEDELFRENNKMNLMEDGDNKNDSTSTKRIRKPNNRYSSIDFSLLKNEEEEGENSSESVSSTKLECDMKRKLETPEAADGDIDYEEVISSKKHKAAANLGNKSPASISKNSGVGLTKPPELSGIQNGLHSAGKQRRIGLPRPKQNNFHSNNGNDADSVKKPAAINNNNNNSIKNQRYASEDLYKPRLLNGLRSRRSRMIDVTPGNGGNAGM